MSAPRVLYFGSLGDGHFLHDEESKYRYMRRRTGPFTEEDLDGGRFVPTKLGRRGRDFESLPQIQSAYRLTVERGWTLLGFWDRTGDSRPGSNSIFLVEGEHDALEVFAAAQRAFPATWTRIVKAAFPFPYPAVADVGEVTP